jgi:transmembrane sensor
MSDAMHRNDEERIEHAAADWLIRRDRGLNAAEQDEFFQWLAADPRHGEWFARHQRTWKEFNLIAQWRPEHSAEPNPDLLAKPRARPRWLAWGAPLAAAAALAFGVVAWREFRAITPTAPVAVATTGQNTRVLEDGSTVELRGDSEISVSFTSGERRVTLARGEAFFTVAKNTARPFIVRASGVDVRAVGTAFNVRLDPQAVEVLVTEGTVHVTPPPSLAHSDAAAEIPLVEAGHRAIVPTQLAAPPPAVAAVTDEDIARALAWQPRLLDFDSTPLAQVIAEFNARNRTQLALGDESLAALPIVATFRSDNVEGFVRLLEANGSVRAERRGGSIILHAVR